VAGFPATAWPEASALGGRTCTSSARPRPHAPLPPGRLRSGLGRALRSTARRHQPGPRLRPPASQSHIFGRRTRQHQHRTLSSSQELADHSPLRSGKEAALGQARSAGQPGTPLLHRACARQPDRWPSLAAPRAIGCLGRSAHRRDARAGRARARGGRDGPERRSKHCSRPHVRTAPLPRCSWRARPSPHPTLPCRRCR